jgi:localization factor PodJL
MKHTLPWNVTGIPPEAREVARSSAQREGITVGEWLTRCIERERAKSSPLGELTQAAPPDLLPARSALDHEAAIRRIDEALGALSRRVEVSEAVQSRSQQAIGTAVDQIRTATQEQALAVQHLANRIDGFESHPDTSPLREAVKGLHQGLARFADELAKTANESASQIAAVANNVQGLAGAIANAQDESRESAKSAEARMADFDARIQQTEREFAAVLRLEERFNEMEARIATAASAEELGTEIQAGMSLAEARMQENLDRQFAGLDGKLENLAARLEKADLRENPARMLEESFRTLDARLETAENKHRQALADFETKLAGIAVRIESLETAPKPEAPVHPAFAPLEPSPYAAEPAPFSFSEEAPQDEGEDVPSEPRAHSFTDDYLARARRAAQATSQAEPERVKWRGEPADALVSISAEHGAIRRAAKPMIVAAVVLFVIVVGLQLSGAFWRVPGVAALQLNKTQTAKRAPAPIPTAVKSGVPDGGETAAAQLTAQAEAGDAKAALALGLKYANGEGSGPDDAQAMRWLLKAAQAGEAVAQYRLGTFYEKGRGVDADPNQAIHWYSEAAKAGNRKAMHNLAVAYANGTGGRKNLSEAVRWFQTAAELGMTDSQFNLAVLYERGLGVRASLPQAYEWYAIAAAAGDSESKARAEALASQITAEEREAADNMAHGYKPRPMNLAANDGP